MHDERSQMQQPEHRRQLILRRVEQTLTRKNTEFILDHQNDSLEALSKYLQACMESIGHPPARVEVIGGDYIEYRFGTWQKALRSFYAGKMTEAKNPPPFEDRQIVHELYDAEEARLQKREAPHGKEVQV